MAKTTSDLKLGVSGAKAKPLPKGGAADARTIRTPLTQNPHAIREHPRSSAARARDP